MTKQQLQKAWQKIRYEIIHNKPNLRIPYPPKVVRMRELLELAGVVLGKIESHNKSNFHQKLYEKIMSEYNRQKA